MNLESSEVIHEDVYVKLYRVEITEIPCVVCEVRRKGYSEVYVYWKGGYVRNYTKEELIRTYKIDQTTIRWSRELDSIDMRKLYSYMYYTTGTFKETSPYFKSMPLSYEGIRIGSVGLEALRDIMELQREFGEFLEGVLDQDIVNSIMFYDNLTEYSIGDVVLKTRLYKDHEDCISTLIDYSRDVGLQERIAHELQIISGIRDVGVKILELYKFNKIYRFNILAKPYVYNRVLQEYTPSERVLELVDSYDRLIFDLYDSCNLAGYIHEEVEGSSASDIRDLVYYKERGIAGYCWS